MSLGLKLERTAKAMHVVTFLFLNRRSLSALLVGLSGCHRAPVLTEGGRFAFSPGLYLVFRGARTNLHHKHRSELMSTALRLRLVVVLLFEIGFFELKDIYRRPRPQPRASRPPHARSCMEAPCSAVRKRVWSDTKIWGFDTTNQTRTIPRIAHHRTNRRIENGRISGYCTTNRTIIYQY